MTGDMNRSNKTLCLGFEGGPLGSPWGEDLQCVPLTCSGFSFCKEMLPNFLWTCPPCYMVWEKPSSLVIESNS